MRPQDVLARPLFVIDGEERTWADVVDAAQAWGVWSDTERRAMTPAPAPSRPEPAALRQAVEELATSFRYERRLLSVDDTEEWFAQWGVTLSEWLAHLQRQVLGEPASDTDAAAWLDAIVSGTFERTARRLAAGLAVHRAVGGMGMPDVAEIDAAMRAFRRQTLTRDGVATVVADHHLDWTAFDVEHVDFADEGAAREVVYCVREDRIPIVDVAVEAGVRMTRARVVLDEAPPELRGLLCGAAAGDLLGPVLIDDLWRVVAVRARVEPTTRDPDTMRRARRSLVARAVQQEVSRRVRWLDPAAAPPA